MSVRWINLDGMLHVTGDDSAMCSCEREYAQRQHAFATCRRCGGPQHWQGVYGGIMESCPGCDAADWSDGPMPPHDDGVVR